MYLVSARIEIENATVFSKESDDATALPASSLQRTLQDIESSIISEKEKLGKQDQQTSKNGALLKSNVVKTKPTGTPEYNPTPINELKEQKIKGQLGSASSKYELALLDGPSTDGEYDPASNFSTSSSGNTDPLPGYARQLSGRVKRKAGDENEAESPLAKIPKFVSVEYTPTVLETSELTDDEGEPVGNFSDDQSEKDSENEIHTNKELASEQTEVKKGVIEESSSFPLEFTPDGFVKTVYEKQDQKEYVDSDKASKTSKEVKNKIPSIEAVSSKERQKHTVSKSENNIFNMFKEEFDNILEACDKESGKLKDFYHKSNSHSSNLASGCKSKSKPTTSLSKTDKKSGDQNKTNSPKSHKEDKSHRHGSHHKHSSHHSSSKQATEQSASGTTPTKNGSHKSHSSSSKHKHSSSSSKHSDSKHSSSGHSSDSRDATKHEHRSSSSKHNSVKSTSKHKSDHSHDKKANSHHSKTISKEKPKSKTSGVSNTQQGSSGEYSKKKHIMNLDVDLFGNIDMESDHSPRQEYDDDLADLDKYFEEDPFDECLRIFNEESAKTLKHSGDKKVCNSS